MAQPAQHQIDIARAFAGQGDAVVLFVAGQKLAVAVHDQPARRGQKLQVDAVLFSQKLEFIGLFHAQIAGAGPENDQKAAHQSADKQAPAGELPGLPFGIAHRAAGGAFHSRLP